MVKKKSIEKVKSVHNAPEGVKILAVLYFVGALISFVAGGFLFSFSDNVSQNAALFVQQGVEIPSPITLILFGIALLGFAVLEYSIAKDILKLKNWARNAIVVFSVFGIVTAISNLTDKFFASGVFSLLVNGFIIWYLMFKIETRKAFE
ncbi:hypothetical protein KAJ38_02340 [Candidatus Pacearchaeota archaeon]|nr:hypothetical protein [Candidatus Pacearchaeota archaeon]